MQSISENNLIFTNIQIKLEKSEDNEAYFKFVKYLINSNDIGSLTP